MRKINLTEAKSHFTYCAVNDLPGLVRVSTLNDEQLKSNIVYACAPFLFGYIKTDLQIVPDLIKSVDYGNLTNEDRAELLKEFNCALGKKEEPKKSPTLLMLEDKQNEIFKTVNLLKHICFTLAKEAGWHDEPVHDAVRIALMHSELSEALEGLRKDVNDDHLPHHKMETVELADVIIRIMDYAGYKGLNISSAIIEKLMYNQQRQDHKRENRNQDGGKKF